MRKLLIEFEVDGDGDAANTHRVRNFAEDLHRALTDNELAEMSVDEIDRATDKVHVRVKAVRDLGSIEMLIKRKLRHHRLSARIRSERK
jgi:hypothetical protein